MGEATQYLCNGGAKTLYRIEITLFFVFITYSLTSTTLAGLILYYKMADGNKDIEELLV